MAVWRLKRPMLAWIATNGSLNAIRDQEYAVSPHPGWCERWSLPRRDGQIAPSCSHSVRTFSTMRYWHSHSCRDVPNGCSMKWDWEWV
jgi:hypothetical protein